ncbi:MAG: group II truncated hemoglobin [Burkholderiaceae bacterium]
MNDSNQVTNTGDPPARAFGDGNASFLAAGGEDGIARLTEAFYRHMRDRPGARKVLEMHDPDLTVSVDKLSRFLCGWLGGPRRYNEKYGQIRLPFAHAHLPIEAADGQAWLDCMQAALDEQPYEPAFVEYLMRQFAIPVQRIVLSVASAGRPVK